MVPEVSFNCWTQAGSPFRIFPVFGRRNTRHHPEDPAEMVWVRPAGCRTDLGNIHSGVEKERHGGPQSETGKVFHGRTGKSPVEKSEENCTRQSAFLNDFS